MEVSGQLHAPVALFSIKDLGTHWTGGYSGTGFGLDAVAKTTPIPAPAENRTSVVRLVA
jgi:hypothetical protein